MGADAILEQLEREGSWGKYQLVRPSGNRSSARAAVEPSDLDEEEADSDAGPLRRCCSFIIISALFPVAASRSFALFFWWEEERNGRRAPQGGTRELSSVK